MIQQTSAILVKDEKGTFNIIKNLVHEAQFLLRWKTNDSTLFQTNKR